MDPARKIAVKVNGDILISIKFLCFFSWKGRSSVLSFHPNTAETKIQGYQLTISHLNEIGHLSLKF